MEQAVHDENSAGKRIIGSALAVPFLAAVIGFGLAIVATIIFATIFFDGGSNSSSEGDGLAVLVVFVLSWAASSVLVSPVVAFFFARHPALALRNRLALTVLLGTWVPLSFVAGGGAAWFGYRSGLEYIGGAIGVVIGVALIATAVVLPDKLRLRNVWLTTVAVGLIFTVGVVLLEPGHRRSIYSADPPPFGLIDEVELSASLPGWRLGGYHDAPRDAGWPFARIVVFTSTGAELEVALLPVSRGCSARDTCAGMAALDDGAAITVWSDSLMCGSPQQSSYVSVDAERASGKWSVDSKNRCFAPQQPSLDELRSLLNVIRPVSLDEWIDAT